MITGQKTDVKAAFYEIFPYVTCTSAFFGVSRHDVGRGNFFHFIEKK